MLRLRFVIATATALGIAGGCSHQQKVSQPPPALPSPPKAPPIAKAPKPTPPPVAIEQPKIKEGDAIFFDFDSAVLRDDARPVLQAVAESLRARAGALKVEGNCDELGTVEYNLALGEQRARAAKAYLVHMGVPPEKIATISYGSQRPKDSGHDAAARARNRRDDLVIR